MNVCVIIPVYNAEAFLEKAVLSALSQKETAEVILIEDKSTDKSFYLCEKLSKENPKVKLLQHEDKGNHGAGASRNIGIMYSDFEYISFLDADDYYLPNRFKQAKQIFESDPLAEGVYEAVGTHYYDSKTKELFIKSRGVKLSEANTYLSTIYSPVNSDQLFYHFIKGDIGYFHTDGITIKKSLFNKTGLFNTDLRLSQDSNLYVKMCYKGKLVAGELTKPVAMRGVHNNNRSIGNTKEKKKYRKMHCSDLIAWAYKEKVDKLSYRLILRNYILNYYFISPPLHNRKGVRMLSLGFKAVYLFFRCPHYFLKAI